MSTNEVLVSKNNLKLNTEYQKMLKYILNSKFEQYINATYYSEEINVGYVSFDLKNGENFKFNFVSNSLNLSGWDISILLNYNNGFNLKESNVFEISPCSSIYFNGDILKYIYGPFSLYSMNANINININTLDEVFELLEDNIEVPTDFRFGTIKNSIRYKKGWEELDVEYKRLFKEVLNSKFASYMVKNFYSREKGRAHFEFIFENNRKVIVEENNSLSVVENNFTNFELYIVKKDFKEYDSNKYDLSVTTKVFGDKKNHYVNEPSSEINYIFSKLENFEQLFNYLEDIIQLPTI